MECNKDEAIRAKKIAEDKMMNDDFEGARKIALKAKKLFPELDNISQLLAVCDVHCSAEKKINGTVNDLYGILQVEKLADDATIKKQYKKLALVLHPDKNHFPGAEAAFKYICEAHMILSDKEKRYSHDAKCKDSAKPTVSKPQNRQGDQDSHGNMQFGAQSKNVNAPTSNGRPSFWTFCPFCSIKYEYYRELVNKIMKCQSCLKLFTAYDIGAHQSAQPTQSGYAAGMRNVNPGFGTGGPTSSQQEEIGKQKKAKVDSQKTKESFSRFANQHPRSTGNGDAKVDDRAESKEVENGNLNAKNGKQRVATKQTGGNPSGVSDSNGENVEGQKRCRKRAHVSNSEETLDDLSPEKRFKSSKSSSDVKGKQKKVAPEAGPKVAKRKENVDAEGSMQSDNNDENGHSKPNSDSEEDDTEPVYVTVQDLEFGNFDRDKEEHCFAVDQVWAVYDTIDGMPRFYAQIRKVYSCGFKLRITWLEADPEKHSEKLWAKEGLPFASGRFKRGGSEETKDRLMFSHRVSFEKGIKRFSFVIYPKKGEIWALFKDWDIKWSSDPENHKEYKFEIVELLSDFDNDNGILVAFMVKVEGFVSLFQKTSRARLAEHRIPSSEVLRFSHQIPSLKLTGNERADIPVGSFELDTASLPDDVDQFYFTSNKVKVKPEEASVQNVDSCAKSPETKVNDFVAETLNLRRSPRGVKGNYQQSNGDGNKSNIATPSKGGKESKAKMVHDFDLDKQKRKFEEGQIWAIRASEDGDLTCYAQIKKMESSPLKLYVDSLELCHDAIRPNACGLYKVDRGGRKTLEPDSFLYHVKAELNGKNRFNIYPREKEIWVLHKKKDLNCTFVDESAGAGDSDVVEVVDNSCGMIKVLLLSRVPGYKSVFRGLERFVEIPLAESDRFIGRVPAFLLTEEIDGHLRGCWELHLTEFPGLLAT